MGSTMDNIHYNLDAELHLRVGSELLANRKRIELLKQIEQLENLTKAAKLAGYSYKGAWDAMDQMATLSGGELIERFAGGKGGGRTKLTPRGTQLIKNFMLIQEEHQRFIQRLNTLANGLSADYSTQADIAMKTSVRNQFAGLIVSILQGPVSDEIELLIKGSHTIKAAITHESCRELQLDIGSKVFALIKASGVMISRDQISTTKNNFEGIIQILIQGEKKSEITLRCDEGLELVSTLTNDELNRLALKKGERAFAHFDASSVIIGIAA
jgi:molybdate transport system regulatory protein